MNTPQRILLVGATGTLGSALFESLKARGHQVVTASRTTGDFQVDVTSPASIERLYEAIGRVDAVATATGHVPYKLLADMTPADFEAGFRQKILSQIEVVRQGLPYVGRQGSFTLITGIFGRSPIPTATAAAMANGAVEAFARAAAIEIAPQRINVVSPTVFESSVSDAVAGWEPVSLSSVASAYVRSIEGADTGRVFELGQ